MSFTEAFFGSTQSQFTAYAIFAAIISICISIILTGTDMTIGNRFLLIFFLILAVLPSVLLMLLQITCMVTGGNENDHWWCWLYSWIIAIFVIIYCIFIIIIALSSLFTYNNAINKIDINEQNNKMSPESSNNYAKMMIETNSKDAIEKFMNSTEEDMIEMTNPQVENEMPTSSIPEEFEDNAEQGFANKEEEQNSIQPAPIPTPIKLDDKKTSNLPVPQEEKKKPDTFVSKSMLDDDEPEPFTNRNYASIL
jgi:hypothetical protein